MDRKGPRGSKPKNVPPKDLFALGSKSSSSSSSASRGASSSGSSELQSSQLPHDKPSHASAYQKSSNVGSDRGREAASTLTSKKPVKQSFQGSRGVTRQVHLPLKTPPGDIQEGWEGVAENFEVEDLIPLIEAAEDRDDFDKIEAYLCGAAKMLKGQRTKPDNLLCMSLLFLAKTKPGLFNTSLIVDAFCSLLKKGEYGLSFKAKSNASVSVLAANILYAVFQEEKCWPEIFIKVFIEDSLAERLWVDNEDCKAFVDNIIASFRTKVPAKSLLFPDIGLGSRPECPSPVSINSGIESGDGDSEMSLECKENIDVTVINRYTHMTSEVEEMIIETVQIQLNLRHQNVDSVARNFIKFLSTVCGFVEVRRLVAPKLEIWLQNHKHQRPAIELLMTMCLNCNTHSQLDQRIIGHIVHIRIKLKPVTNLYMTCLKELLAAHPDNIASVLKETTFNELSPTRNLSNMAILSVVFQYAPEHAAIILAEIFLELLRNSEDFLRALRALLKEIVRSLRHDMQYQTFCHELMKDQVFKDTFEFKERMFHSIVDLIVFTMFVSISPQVRDGVTQMYKGETKDSEVVRRYQETVSNIQQDAIYWMHRITPKCYAPTKEEYIKNLHKLLMIDSPELYVVKDNFPAESDRPLFFRLASEIPVKQETLQRLFMISSHKEQFLKPQDVLELADKIVKRASLVTCSEEMQMLKVIDPKIIETIFNLCPYIPPENSPLPSGYRPPKTAIANLYWKAWTMLLLITAHNPSIFGVLGWESYPTLRVMMEMCITNSIIFPPPTMAIGEKGGEMNNQELIICSREQHQILEFESHLAQKTITEQNSLLLSQLITMDITGPARKPPTVVLEQLKTLNESHKIGHLLCRCRKPDFLVDIIQRQGAPQSMPWLAQLVESSEDAFSALPVQCLCEFLLSETIMTSEGSIITRHQPLLQHLRCLLLSPRQGEDASVEILEYFLRRLGSQLPSSRTQALRGLQLVAGPLTAEPMEIEPDKQEPYKWLLKHLTILPGFQMVKGIACQALRAACLIETKPAAVSAYIRFLAVHTCEDSLQDISALVQDMAHLIVERSTMISAILAGSEHCAPSGKFVHAKATLDAFYTIFMNYMQGARMPSRDLYVWSENHDHVRVQWASGEQGIMHILVVHAMVILLISGPCASPELFHQLLEIWFPQNQDMPQAFLVDTAQEALLLPDWLKLKMIRSTVAELVDAALKDLEPSQLVLFIQSFGIPVASMTKLLRALDVAVENSKEAVAAAVLDKSHKNYMAQLVEVQHQRGAEGGHSFAATLATLGDDVDVSSERPQIIESPVLASMKPSESSPLKLNMNEVQSFILQCFTCSSLHVEHKKMVKDTIRTLQQHLSKEISNKNKTEKPYLSELLQSLSAIIYSKHSLKFIEGLHEHSSLSTPLFRLLLQLRDQSQLVQVIRQLVGSIIHMKPINSPLTPILSSFDVKQNTCSESDKMQIIGKADVSSEKNALEKLIATSSSQSERLIRDLVQVAMKEGKISLVVNAITQLLIKKLKEQKPGAPGQHIALLLDWLQVLDPELRFISPDLRKLLLFGKTEVNLELSTSSISTAGTKAGYGQAYLLAAFTHQANWGTLETIIHEVLATVDLALNPVTVLDFVWAVLHVPKLWQGRERRKPRHATIELPLKLKSCEIDNLAEYILLEMKTRPGETSLQSRISLLFLCLTESPSVACEHLIRKLTSKIHCKEAPDDSSNISSEFLYHMYLRRPNVIHHLPDGTMDKLLEIQIRSDSKERSAADVSLHTLLTMLTSPVPQKDFVRRMQDLEAAVRKMASTHPLLVIRQLPLLASTLQGLTHLHFQAFQSKNYPELFSMILGILELLHPLIFYEKYVKSFTKILKAYIELFEAHGVNRELGSMLMRVCQLLMAWVGTRCSFASTFIAKHGKLFSSLLRVHPEMLPLRSLAAIAVSKGTDHPKGEKRSVGSLKDAIEYVPLPVWMQQQARDVQSQLETFKTSEQQNDLLKRVRELSDHSMGNALPPFFHCFAQGLLSSDSDNRDKSWNLLIQLLRRKPKMASQISCAVLSAMNNEEIAIASTAVEHLLEVILMLHEFAPDLMSAGFNVCLCAEPGVTDMLSEALFLLTINTGA